MPVYHFVLHAYGSWHPDHPDGWHQHGEPGTLAPNLKLGEYRRRRQRWDAATFPADHHAELLEMIRDICSRRQWRCHAIAVTITHIHALVSWREPGPFSMDVQSTLKRLTGWKLATLTGIAGRRWLSDGGAPTQVKDTAHFDFLVTTYLRDQGGLFWREP